MKGNGNGKAHRLTERQAKFVRGVAGGKTATQAAKDAGYGVSYANREGKILLDKPHIQKHLAEITEKIAAPDIADASARQKWWTDVMNDTTEDIKARLKASELLAKSQGDFIEQREVKGNVLIRVIREEAGVSYGD